MPRNQTPSNSKAADRKPCAACKDSGPVPSCQPERMLCVTAALRQRSEGARGRQTATVGPTVRAPGRHPACGPVHEVAALHAWCLKLVLCGRNARRYLRVESSWKAEKPCIQRSLIVCRNVYRGTAKMFSQDAVALELVDKLLARSTCMPLVSTCT